MLSLDPECNMPVFTMQKKANPSCHNQFLLNVLLNLWNFFDAISTRYWLLLRPNALFTIILTYSYTFIFCKWIYLYNVKLEATLRQGTILFLVLPVYIYYCFNILNSSRIIAFLAVHEVEKRQPWLIPVNSVSHQKYTI